MKWWVAFGVYTAFIALVLVGAYLDVIPTEIGFIPMYDSIGHFVLYGVWFYLLHEALSRKTVWIIPTAFLILFPIVALEEIAQSFASTRTFSLVDLFWGFAGMVVAWSISKITVNKKAFYYVVLFIFIYGALVLGTVTYDQYLVDKLNSFDLNNDTFFSVDEQTPEQQKYMLLVISDIGRNLMPIYALFISLACVVFVAVTVKIGQLVVGWRKMKVKRGMEEI